MTAKPATHPLMVPDDLAELPRWGVWRSEDGRRKVPYRINGWRASSTDPRHWGELEDARVALASGKYSGLAFVFVKADGLVGIDLDDCLDPEGTPKP
jgi:putative DNA primase/helicase